MTRVAIAPLRDDAVLVDDGDVLVVDKPALVSTQSDGSSDLVARARAWLARRDGVPVAETYVAAHQLLEREASGVVVLLRKRELNAPFQRALAEGRLERSYVACVERKGRRALVEVDLARGKLRDALTRLGAVAGVEGSNVLAYRPLVHARLARFPHPRTGALVEARAPVPVALERWASGAFDVAPALADGALLERLRDAASLRWGLAQRSDLDAFRLVNDAADGLPGVVVDLYGEHAVLSVLSEEARANEGALAAALVELGARGVYVKRRPKQANVVADTRTDEVAPSAPIAGEAAPGELVIREGDDRFLVRLGDGLSTGVFLDQRDGRAWLRGAAAGRSVLNLFAYACAFTVSAARGGAARTTSVDVSRAALAWGEENLAANGISAGPPHTFVVDDALAFLGRARARGDRFDIVVLDPPSYATTKTSRFTAEHDYVTLAEAALRVVSPRGFVLACTNHRGIGRARFRGFLREAARRAGRAIAKERERLPPDDFPPQPGEEPHLKTIVLELG